MIDEMMRKRWQSCLRTTEQRKTKVTGSVVHEHVLAALVSMMQCSI